MRDHEEFEKAIRVTRDLINTDRIRQTNIKMCMGYKYDEITREPALPVIMAALGPEQKITNDEIEKMMETLGVDKDGMIKTKKVKKHKHPDPTLIKNYLFNKTKGEFQQRQAVELEAGKSLIDAVAKAGILNASD